MPESKEDDIKDDTKDDGKFEFNPKINIAIDFGTDGTGVAYSFPGGDTVYIYGKFEMKNKDGGRQSISKLRTAILLDSNGKFKAFGQNALLAYGALDDPSDVLLFDHFKMNLCDMDMNGKRTSDIRSKVKAINGHEIDTEIVFVESFKYLYKEIIKGFKKDFRKHKIDLKLNISDINDIQWIVTVPAIWDDAAKDKMIKWINKAGLTNKNIKDHCILKYEPDCASLSLQNEILSKKIEHKNDDDSKETLIRSLSGKKYILIDSGGGTVDIACHEFLNDGGVKELHYPSGGPWGDTNIDKAFIEILSKVLSDVSGNDLYIEIWRKNPIACMDLLKNLRKNKIKFDDTGDNKFIGIKFPSDFEHEIDQAMTIDNFHDKVFNFKIDEYSECFEYETDTSIFSMKCIIWKKYLYDPLIDKVIQHLKTLPTKDGLSDFDYMYLVGGYTMTPYYQKKLIKEFGLNSEYKIDIIIPPKPILSVVDGAARMGLYLNQNRQYVRIRIASKTYAVAVGKLISNLDISKYDPKFVKENKKSDETGEWLYDCLDIYTRKGDSIIVGETINLEYARQKGSNECVAPIYCSDDINPLTIHDAKYLGEVRTKWNKNNNQRRLINEITFGECMEITAFPACDPQNVSNVEINYEWK